MPNVERSTSDFARHLVETYGACEHDCSGAPLPKQTVFHPARSLATDGVSLDNLVVTAAITFPETDPCTTDPSNTSPSTPSNVSATPTESSQVPAGEKKTHLSPRSSLIAQKLSVSKLQPGGSMIFPLHLPEARTQLLSWIQYATVLVGKDLIFDLLYLRALPDFRDALDGHHLVIDLAVLNYLYSELRPERSLKDISIIQGDTPYTRTIAGGRFQNPDSPALHQYNATDTHRTLKYCATLIERIQHEFPSTSKLSPTSLTYFSDLIWSSVRMAEAGLPLSLSKLQALETKYGKANAILHTQTKKHHDLILGGPGRNLSRDVFLDRCLSAIKGARVNERRAIGPLSIEVPERYVFEGSDLLEFTKVKMKLSWSDLNRQLLHDNLLDGCPERYALDAAKVYDFHQKRLDSYLFPLLHHSKQTKKKDSIVIPFMDCGDAEVSDEVRRLADSCGGLAYPHIFVVPSQFDVAGEPPEGGQKQARPSFKGPAAQTFPQEIRNCYSSRFGRNGVLLALDIKQSEYAWAALLSGDETMMSDIKAGIDPHETRAIKFFGDECFDDNGISLVPDFRTKYRQPAKHSVFGDLYWCSGGKLQWIILKKAGRLISREMCDDIVRKRPTLRPGLYAWQKELVARAKREGRIELPFTGHSRYFLGGTEYEDSEIVNFPTQATSAISLIYLQNYLHKLVLPALNAPNPAVYFYLNVYDSLCFDCRDALTAAHLKSDLAVAMQWLNTEGYWAWWCDRLGRSFTLSYDLKESTVEVS